MSNRLQKISDAVTHSLGYPYKPAPADIGYDSNGNMTSFADKGISSIQYNYLNLPRQITQNTVTTNYTYRADGVKLKKLYQNLETDYLDGFQYKYTYASEDLSGNTIDDGIKLRVIPTSEGYYDALNELYVYNYVDHLGNVRISYGDGDHDGMIKGRDERIRHCSDAGNGNQYCYDEFFPGEIVANNTYYPFGMLFDHNNQANSSNAYKYKYNGKELQETGFTDFGSRQYMNDLGRWFSPDALSEEFSGWSPYNYGLNNPIRFIDPDGNAPEDAVDDEGCCSNLKGFGLALLDNVTGGNLTQRYDDGSPSYRKGVLTGNITSGVAGILLTASGGSDIGAGGVGLVASESVSATGVGTIAGVPGGAASGGLILAGTAKVGLGAWMMNNASKNIKNDNSKASSSSESSSAKRGSFRKGTIKESWDNAKNGSKPNTKQCPTCKKDVKGNPHNKEKRTGPDGWDMSHNPSWTKRDHTGMTRKEQLDDYNKGAPLECASCNRSGGNNDSRFH